MEHQSAQAFMVYEISLLGAAEVKYLTTSKDHRLVEGKKRCQKGLIAAVLVCYLRYWIPTFEHRPSRDMPLQDKRCRQAVPLAIRRPKVRYCMPVHFDRTIIISQKVVVCWYLGMVPLSDVPDGNKCSASLNSKSSN